MLLISSAAYLRPRSSLMPPRWTCAATSPSTDWTISSWLSTLALRSSNITLRVTQALQNISTSIASQAAISVPHSFWLVVRLRIP
ncbi:hypothetical protein D3C81_1713390 [compost metagenome]